MNGLCAFLSDVRKLPADALDGVVRKHSCHIYIQDGEHKGMNLVIRMQRRKWNGVEITRSKDVTLLRWIFIKKNIIVKLYGNAEEYPKDAMGIPQTPELPHLSRLEKFYARRTLRALYNRTRRDERQTIFKELNVTHG